MTTKYPPHHVQNQTMRWQTLPLVMQYCLVLGQQILTAFPGVRQRPLHLRGRRKFCKPTVQWLGQRTGFPVLTPLNGKENLLGHDAQGCRSWLVIMKKKKKITKVSRTGEVEDRKFLGLWWLTEPLQNTWSCPQQMGSYGGYQRSPWLKPRLTGTL